MDYNLEFQVVARLSWFYLTPKTVIRPDASYFFNVPFNIVVSPPGSTKLRISFRFREQKFVCIYHLPMRAASPIPSSLS
jgi:hypothetical protein